MADTKTPDTKTIEFLYNGLLNFYPDVAKGVFKLKGSFGFHDYWGGFKRMDFLDFILNLTSSSTIEEAADTVRTWREGEENERTVPINIDELVLDLQNKEAEKASAYEKSVAAKKALLESQKQREKLQALKIRYKTAQVKKETVEKKVYLNTPEKVEVPPLDSQAEANLNLLVSEAKKDPADFSAKLSQKIALDYQNNIPGNNPELIKNNAQLIALDFTQQVLNLDQKDGTLREKVTETYVQNPIHQVATLANPNNLGFLNSINNQNISLVLATQAQNTALVLDNDYALAKTYLSSTVDNKLLSYFYPGSQELLKLKVSENSDANTVFEINPNTFLAGSQSFNQENDLLLGRFKNQSFDQIQNLSSETLNNLAKNNPAFLKTREELLRIAGGLTTKEFYFGGMFIRYSPELLSLWSTEGIPLLVSSASGLFQIGGSGVLLSPISNFNLGGLFGVSRAAFTTAEGFAGRGIGINIGNYGLALTKVATKGGSKLAISLFSKGAAKGAQLAFAAAETGVVATGAGTGAAVTSWSGPGMILGALIGAVVGFITKKVWPAIKRLFEENKEVLLGLLGIGTGLIGLGLGLPPIIAAIPMASGGLSILGKFSGKGGVGQGITGVFNSIKAGFGVALASLLGPLGIGFESLAILTIFIIFIINTGAYMVPPTVATTNSVNPYLKIEKTIEPDGSSLKSFANNELPKTVTYKVKVTPLKSDITNLKFQYKCSVIKANSSPNCPQVQGDFPTKTIKSVPIGETFEFTYTHTFTSPTFIDTLTIDTITATVDVSAFDTVSGVTTSASVKIGNPPEDCPIGWPIGPEGNEPYLVITQGPGGAYSHNIPGYTEAMDIAATVKHSVSVTHSGVITGIVRTDNSFRPLYMEIKSVCNGKEFISRYAHLFDVEKRLKVGTRVTMGEKIGLSGTNGTGGGSGPHLHYEFVGIKMNPPYVPKSPRGCSNSIGLGCGVVP